jgi:hypothetical protein
MWFVLALCIFSIAMVLKAVLSAVLHDKSKEKGKGETAADFCYRIEVKK